ncbi:hypothetical protein Dsin_014189 [Dipteronia sinensis]|uniref:PGG domain-containing protein n=1 Tax=Dipteronia sinensis TaxID=43782 RepID=A0AAE0AMK8_9ROSI|nr:hypothetical protein Dsin_014189 [Dipteronia sinensis]
MPNSISEEPINRLPSNLGGSAHQSQLFMPNSSSEEPIHPLPSNLGGSAHQPDQLSKPKSEPEIPDVVVMLPEEEEEEESEGAQPNVSPSSQSNSNLGGSAHQSQLFMPKSSSEEPIHQLPTNLGGSSHQTAQFSDSEIELDEFWTAEHLNYYRPLFNAAQRGDWETAKRFIDNDPDALTVQISVQLGTVLHIAAHCCQWKFVLRLLELGALTPQSFAEPNSSGNTVLHHVAVGGSLKTAKALVEKNSDLLQMVNNRGELPLFYAIDTKSKELVWYLSLKTRVESPSSPFFIPELPKILRKLIHSGYHDIALFFVQRFPSLALATDEYGNSLLVWLADNPSYFFSGKCTFTVLVWFKRLLWKAITQLAPSIKIVRDAKMTHECAIQLVNHVVNQIELSPRSFSEICHFLQNPISILRLAIHGGIEEIVRILLRHFPDLIFMGVGSQRNILKAAIEYRQEKIVNIIKEISPSNTTTLCAYTGEDNNTTLNLAGKLAPAFKLFSVSGAALQMQRELQWFKEVEKITLPYYRKRLNMNSETPIDVFRIAHRELAKEGEKWMKDTANSCMLVSTLIATVLFAAAFTVPGGNDNDKGIPIFIRTNAFTIFAISDALGLFSSLTSLLMFLAILTARYAIEDFLESLPKKLIIGLGSLFVAIAAMIISFGATLTIVLRERWPWVFVPITLLASFPVALFVMLQLPLFIQMVQSTYGASIFRPWPSRV